MKRLLCLLVVLLCVVGMASAQKMSPAIVQHQSSAVGHITMHSIGAPQQPTYCSPCFFYGGDGNPSSVNANGLWDNNADYLGNLDGVTYTPFLVAKSKGVHGKVLNVSGVGGNLQMYPNQVTGIGPPVIADVPWSIVTGVATGGSPSTVTTVCSGDDAAPTVTDTGRLWFGFYEEFNVAASATGAVCPLKLSKKGAMYWQANPVHTTTFQLAFEANISDWPTFTNSFGPQEPSDLSFFWGPNFGIPTFVNANTQGFFHAFSADIEGTVGK